MSQKNHEKNARKNPEKIRVQVPAVCYPIPVYMLEREEKDSFSHLPAVGQLVRQDAQVRHAVQENEKLQAYGKRLR
jgi:hypothetical protein